MSKASLVVSIHDVSPSTRATVAAMLAGLARAGVARTSLLVIPDHHYRGNISADPAFCAWLRDAASAGHEIVQHGYYHRREPRPGEAAWTRLMTRLYTAGEGEFYDIAYNDARDLLARGREALGAATGVEPAGFIAPAWLLSHAGELAARALGFEYTTRLAGVTRLCDGRVHESQSLCWSVRSAWRRPVSLGWNACLFRALARNPLMRISLHPPDMDCPPVWKQVLRLSMVALATREATSYGAFAQAI